MAALGRPKLVLGLSGGLDSTHAALSCSKKSRTSRAPERSPRVGASRWRTQNTATAPAQVKPAPKAAISTRDPGWILPSRHDSEIPIGIVAAVVLP